jgi:hypothetical protein
MNRWWVILSIFALVSIVSIASALPVLADARAKDTTWEWYNMTNHALYNEMFSDEFEMTVEREPTIAFATEVSLRHEIYNDDILSFCTYGPLWSYGVTNSIIDEYHKALVNVTNDAEKSWKMSHHYNPANYTRCDARMNYEPVPTEPWQQAWVVLGFLDTNDSILANHTVFYRDYAQTLLDIPDEEWEDMEWEEYQDIIVNGTHSILPLSNMTKIVKHELGHGFGLNHPVSDMMGKKQQSIMDYNITHNTITDDDIRGIVETYTNGFENKREYVNYYLSDEDHPKFTFYMGQRSVFSVDFPMLHKDSDPIETMDIYMFIGGKNHRTMEDADVIFRGNDPLDDSEILNESSRHKRSYLGVENSRVFGLTNVYDKPIDTVDLVFIAKSKLGFSERYQVNDAFEVVPAKFSDIALEYEIENWTMHAASKLTKLAYVAELEQWIQDKEYQIELLEITKDAKNRQEIMQKITELNEKYENLESERQLKEAKQVYDIRKEPTY